MNGSPRGVITKGSWPKTVYGNPKKLSEWWADQYTDLPNEATLETSAKALLNSTTSLANGSVPGLTCVGEYDRAGRHTSLLSVNCQRIGEIEHD
jgi:hypothetical protein